MKNRNILLACAALLIVAFALVASGCDSSAPPAPTAVAPTTVGSAIATAAPSVSGSQATPTAEATGVATSPATVAAGPASSPTALSGQLSFLAFGDPSEAKAFADVAKGFQDANPGVRITTEAVPSQANQLLKLATSFAAGDPPDVFVVDYRRLGLLQNAGVIQPVQKYLEQSTVIKASDFYTKPMEPFTFNGQLQCLPMNMSSLQVYYSKDLFDRARLPYPKDGWTWDEFVRDAKAITALSTPEEKIYGVGVDPMLIRLAPFIWQNGGDIVDNVARPTRLTFDTPAAKEAFQWFVDLQVKNRVVATQAEAASEQDQTRFMFNTLGMWLLSRRVVPALRTTTGFTWDVAPLPVGKQKASILHSDGYCISKASKNRNLAWKFVEYANSPAGQVIASKTGRTVPSLKAIAQSPAYLDPSKPPASSDVFLKMGPYLRTTPQISTWPDIELRTNAIIEQAFYGYISVDEAIKQIEQSTAQSFKGDAFPSSIVIPTPVPGRTGEDD